MGYIMSGGWWDSLVNVMSGMGVPGRDKATAAKFVYTQMTREECEAAYRDNWMARKLIDIPADDATRAWRQWQTDTNIVEALEAEETRLDMQATLRKGLVLANLHGGAALVLGVKQGKASDELDFEAVKQGDLSFVAAVSRYDLGYGQLIRNVEDPNYGKPEYFTRNNAGSELGKDGEFRIHPSRVIMLQGMQHPDPFQSGEIWGDSKLQSVRDAVQGATSVIQSIASLITEAKFDIIKIPDLSQNIATQVYQNRLTARFAFANTMKSFINTLVLDKEEEWERKEINFSQLPNLMQMFLLVASGAADIPATRFLGQSAIGLNATGEGDLQNYYDRVNSDQTNKLSPVLAPLDDVLIRSSLGSRDPSIYYTWNPLWQLSMEQKATVAKAKADTANIDATMGLIDPEALRIGRQNQLIEDGTYPGLEQALEQQDQLDMESMQSVEEQQAQAEAEMKKQAELAQAGAKPNGKANGSTNPFQKTQSNGNGQFGARDERRPRMAVRKTIRLGGRRRPTRDFNENHDPETGQFTFAGAGAGPGGSGDPYQIKRTASSAAAISSGFEAMHTGGYVPQHAAKGKALEKRRAEISATVDRYKDYPTSQRMVRLMEEHAGVMKELRRLRLAPSDHLGFGKMGGERDVVIIGGGPAGLNALVNSAYEGMDAVLFEGAERIGGQARASSGIKNVAGTPYGTKGAAYFDKMAQLAALNGGEIRTSTKVTGLTYDPKTGVKTVHLNNGEEVRARNVILAGGVQFRTMKFEGSDGPGVYYGDGSAMTDYAGRGGTAVVIGGSNGAAQAAIGAANSGVNVVVLARSGLDKMSDDPKTVLTSHPRIKVITGTEIDRLERNDQGRPTAVVTKDGQRIETDALGLFLGQAPSTKWLPPEIAVNEKGFVRADVNLRSTMPGVFVPGDMREDGPQRVQLSGGEGQKAAKEIFRYMSEQVEAVKRGDPTPHIAAWQRLVTVPEAEHKQLLTEKEAMASQISALQEQLRKLRAGLTDEDPTPDKPGKMTFTQWDQSVDMLRELDDALPYLLQCVEENEDDDEVHRAAGLRDFNPNHDPDDGRFSSGGGSGSKSSAKGSRNLPSQSARSGHREVKLTREAVGKTPQQRASTYERLQASGEGKHPGPKYSGRAVEDENGIIHSDNVDDIARALYEGRKVNMVSQDEVALAIDRVGELASRLSRWQKKSGKGEARTFDLCNLTVEGTNLFCAESKGIPRVQMPQLKGVPLPNSQASRLPADARGEVDIQQAFRDHLLKAGYTIDDTSVAVDHLKASQNELDGEKIAGIANAIRGKSKYKYDETPLFISDDNYVVDGHHRWAAKVATDFDDGILGNNTTMPVSRVNLPITDLLDLSLKFAREMGIPQVGVAHRVAQVEEPKLKKKDARLQRPFRHGFELVEDFNPNHDPDDGRFASGSGGGSGGGAGGSSRTREGSTGFVSPNVHDLKIEQAEKNITSSRRQKLLNEAVREIHEKLQLEGQSAPVIGAWADGAENSVMVSYSGENPEVEKAALMMEGYIADQKAVLYFKPDTEGTEFMARFTVPCGQQPTRDGFYDDCSAVEVHKDLLERGLAFHTLRPTSNGTVVYVYGQDQETLDKFGAAANAYNAEFAVSRGKGEFIGTTKQDGTDWEQRDDARRVYEERLSAAAGGKVGPVWQELRDRWTSRLEQSRDAAILRDGERLNDYNPNHDPQTGEFSSGGGSSSGSRGEPSPRKPAGGGARSGASRVASSHPPLKGTKPGSHPDKISPSVTSTKFATVSSNETYVPTGVKNMLRHRPSFDYNVKLFTNPVSFPGLRADEVQGEPEKVARAVVDRMKDNLRYLYSHASDDQRKAASWYRESNKLLTDKARQYGLSEAAVAGAYAALSPQKDWSQNFHLSTQLIDIYMTKQGYQWDKRMSDTAKTIWKAKDAGDVKAVTGKRLDELTDPGEIAMWIRTYEQTYGDPAQPPPDPAKPWQHGRGFREFGYDGLGDYRINRGNGEKSTVTWNTKEAIANAVASLQSGGDRDKISAAMGEKHKVRNFYNNLLDPDGTDGDVTIDSHAVGAAWMRGSPETAKAQALASHPGIDAKPEGWEPARNNKANGVFGTYGFYADAYREVADEVGLLPDQLQAVIWVVKRDVFIDMTDKASSDVDKAWNDFHAGTKTLQEAQDTIWQIAEQDRQHKVAA